MEIIDAMEMHELANLLSLIGPFPRTVELLLKSKQLITENQKLLTLKSLYEGTKSLLTTKYEQQRKEMISGSVEDVLHILRYLLEGLHDLDDSVVEKAVIRGLVSVDTIGKLSIVFLYLHTALSNFSQIDATFLDRYVKYVFAEAANATTMEELIADFITFKHNIYYRLNISTVPADKFFHGARLNKEVSEIEIPIGTEMECVKSAHCTSEILSDIYNMKAEGVSINLKKRSTEVIVGSNWSGGDGIISFNPKHNTHASVFMVYEAKKQVSTSFEGLDTKDSFEHEQNEYQQYLKKSKISDPCLFLYCNAGSTNVGSNDMFKKVAGSNSMLVDKSNWTSFFKIIPRQWVPCHLDNHQKLIPRVGNGSERE